MIISHSGLASTLRIDKNNFVDWTIFDARMVFVLEDRVGLRWRIKKKSWNFY